MRRFQVQVFQPDLDGWHTVVTAATPEALETSARLLNWQTGKRVRIVDPDGQVLRETGTGNWAAPSTGAL